MTDGELDTVLIQTDCIQKAADIRVNNQAFQLELKFLHCATASILYSVIVIIRLFFVL